MGDDALVANLLDLARRVREHLASLGPATTAALYSHLSSEHLQVTAATRATFEAAVKAGRLSGGDPPQLKRSDRDIQRLLALIQNLTEFMAGDFLPLVDDFSAANGVRVSVTDTAFFNKYLNPFDVVRDRRKERTRVARKLTSLETTSPISASAVFVLVDGLRRVSDPFLVPMVLEELHALAATFDSYVLSSISGVILVCPDDSSHAAMHCVEKLSAEWPFSVPLRFGVAHGWMEVVLDVDGVPNLVGVPINTAARLATSSLNEGCAVHESYVKAHDAIISPQDWLHSSVRIQSHLTGKPQDPPFVCYLSTPIVFGSVTDVEALPLQATPAILIAFDLPGFSAGDQAGLRARFRDLAAIVARLRLDAALNVAEVLLSPGGDGGVLALVGANLSPAHAVGMCEVLREWGVAESQGLPATRAIVPRLGVHYGRVLRYRNAYGQWRPTGREVFVADEIAGDEAARQYAGVVLTRPVVDIVVNGNAERIPAAFDEIAALPTAPDVKRYARKVDLATGR